MSYAIGTTGLVLARSGGGIRKQRSRYPTFHHQRATKLSVACSRSRLLPVRCAFSSKSAACSQTSLSCRCDGSRSVIKRAACAIVLITSPSRSLIGWAKARFQSSGFGFFSPSLFRLHRTGGEQLFKVRFECRLRSREVIGKTLHLYAWRCRPA